MPKKITPTHPALFERRYLPLIIVLIFISSAIAFCICYRHHTINTEQTLQKDRSTAEILSLLMEEHLKKIVSAMESYANRPLLLRAAKDKNVKKANGHLVSLTKHYPDINSLIITDRQGTLWTAYPERPELLGKSFAYRDWYKEVSKEWKANISDVVLRVVGEKDIAFQISVPIFDETRQVMGILLSTQRTVGLSSLTKHLPLDSGTFFTITDRKGQIAHSSRHNVEKEIRSYPFHSNIKTAIAANNKTFAVDDPIPGGRTHYISFAPVGDIGWTVLIERDKHSILLSEYAYFVQVTAIVFLLFLLIILFIVYSNKLALIVSEFAESIINTVREPLIALDHNLRIVKVNSSFYEFFKVTPEETIGQLIYDLGNKQWDIPKLRELLETILPQKATFDNYEVEHEFATIGRRVMLLNARQIERVLSKEQIILLAIEDITERKQIESIGRLATVVRDSNDAITIQDIKGNILAWNRGAELMFGYNEQEALQMTIWQLTPPDKAAEQKDFNRRIFAGENVSSFETQRLTKDGRLLDVWLTVTKLVDDTGKITGIAATERDITGRKRVEKESKSAKSLLDTVIDSSPFAMWISDREGLLIRTNRSLRKTLNLTDDQLLGKYNVLKDENLEMQGVMPMVRAVFEKYTPARFIIPWKASNVGDVDFKGGRDLYIDVSIFPILDDNGELTNVVCQWVNISERKRVEEALINSEKKYRNIFENATEGIFQSTPAGRYISVNPAFARIGGYNYPDEMIDTVTDIQKEMYVHQDDRTRLLVLLNKQDIITNFEAEIRRRDNAIIWISMNVKAIRDEDGKVIFLEGTVVDITERKRIEEALRKSEEQIRHLFDNALEGVYQTTPEGRLISVNMAFSRMFGYESPEEAIKTVTDIGRQMYVNPDDRKRAVGIFREMGFIKDFECQMRRKDGSIFWASYNGRLTKTPDGIPCFEGFIMDITERKRAEAALQASIDEVKAMSQQLLQAAKLATMGELASSIAHELNNPLATVSLRVESLIAQTTGDDSRRRELEIIGKEIERMGNLVSNLLQFSRRNQPQISTVDMCDEIEKTLELIHYHLRKHNIPVIREFAPEVPVILADRQQLRQLFLNLFTNASDAMPEGGTLTIRVTKHPEEKQVCIEIADTGVGISPEVLPKIMEPFFTTKSEGKGTGLGLAICRRITQEHLGTFDISSEGIPGKGTKVRITLSSIDPGNSIGLTDP